METKEIQCKTCMTKSKLTDYVVNPYTGCQHACRYCYADFIRRFQNIKTNWGEFAYAKINCPDLLAKELEKNKPGNIFMASVCDCYMPLDGKYQLTRKILEIISKSPYKNKFTMEILTKSALVKRDLDLLKKINVELGCSINTLDEKTARLIEPLASPPRERINALKEAKKQGIRVFGFISPVLPGITDLEEIFKELSFCNYVWVELLNTRKTILDRFIPFINKNFPEKIEDFEFAIKNPEEYYNKIKAEVTKLEKKYNLKVKELVRHSKDR
jgi:DNA repair photolyase